jgi:hypothetical protein
VPVAYTLKYFDDYCSGPTSQCGTRLPVTLRGVSRQFTWGQEPWTSNSFTLLGSSLFIYLLLRRLSLSCSMITTNRIIALIMARTLQLIRIQAYVFSCLLALIQSLFIEKSDTYTAKTSMYIPWCNEWKEIVKLIKSPASKKIRISEQGCCSRWCKTLFQTSLLNPCHLQQSRITLRKATIRRIFSIKRHTTHTKTFV